MRAVRPRRLVHAFNLFVAFSFTVMADPVSSVTYAIEAALGALEGDARDLVLTMGLVIGAVAVIAATYDQLIRRYPDGGGAARSLGEAFGEGWAFLPLGALLVDFTLTVAVSLSAAAASAAIAYLPELAPWRLPLALGLAVAVAAACLLGHRGRVVFATVTLAFGALALVVLALGFDTASAPAAARPRLVGDAALAAALLAMPLGMALATGIEAPTSAIAQLGQLGDRGRELFGRLTVWLLVGILAVLTLGFAALAVRLGIGVPQEETTLLAEIARAATGGGVGFAAFQAVSALLLVAAAASAFLAGSGILKALATPGRGGAGLLPARLAQVNGAYAPPWGLTVLLGAALVLLIASGADEQVLVQFYAVAVFASFLGATVGAAVLFRRERRWVPSAIAFAGATIVAGVLAVNLLRIDAVIALLAAVSISAYLWRRWVAHGRPAGPSRADVSHDVAAPRV